MLAPKKILNIPVENTRYVSKDGSDTYGTGSISKPFLTIGAAMASITTASPTSRFSIMLAPGTYSEAITLKANVFIVGTIFNSSRIIGGVTLDASFSPAGDHRSGFENVFVSGLVAADFLALTSNEGKLYFQNCRFGGGITATAFSTINQLLIYDCELFGTLTLNGMNTFLINCIIQNSGAIICNHAAGTANSLTVSGGSIFNLTVNALIGAFEVFQSGAAQDGATLTINGTLGVVYANSPGLPKRALISLIGGATESQFIRTNDGFGVGFIDPVPANWVAPPPDDVSEALARLSAAVAGLLGGPIP